MSVINPQEVMAVLACDESNNGKNAQGAYNKNRLMMSRRFKNSIGITKTLNPGNFVEGCLVCCPAPGCCPCLAVLPCCGDTEEVQRIKASSLYVYLRENSIEWNNPEVIMKPGPCCGFDPCAYAVSDHVTVLYFDDLILETITDKTRCCNEGRTCAFGGRGERISVNSPICCGMCEKAASPYFCAPVCCPKSICPCMLRHEIYVDDAQQGLFDIAEVIKATSHLELYTRIITGNAHTHGS